MSDRGKLIVFEGVDGSGTTTQAAKLCKKLDANNVNVHQTAQPSNRPIGKLIRQILSGKQIQNPCYQTMALLFAADRQDQQENEILPAIEAGIHVICDRYVHSSVIYQSTSAKSPDSKQWIKTINTHIMAPDLLLHLKIDAETSKARRETRGGEEEIFDKLAFQEKLIATYDQIESIFPKDNIVVIDATQTIEQIEHQVWQRIVPLLPNVE